MEEQIISETFSYGEDYYDVFKKIIEYLERKIKKHPGKILSHSYSITKTSGFNQEYTGSIIIILKY